MVNSNKRLTKPLQRIGAKGEGKFAPISWEAAFETIADKLKHIPVTIKVLSDVKITL